MDKVVSILMRRDNVTEAEAKETIRIVMDEVYDEINAHNFDAAEDAFTDGLGLEIDYMYELMF